MIGIRYLRVGVVAKRCLSSMGGVVDRKRTELPTVKDIPGPVLFPVVGAVPHYLPGIGKYEAKRIAKYSMIKYHEFGPIFKEKMFNNVLVYIIDPDDIAAVLRRKGEGEAVEWPKRTTHLVLEHVRTHEFKERHHNGGIFMLNGEDWAGIRRRHQKAMSIEEIGGFAKSCDELAWGLLADINSSQVIKYHVDTDFLNILFAYATDYIGMILFEEKWNSIDHLLDKNSMTSKLIETSTELNHATGPTDHGAKSWRLFSTPLYKEIKKGAEILDEVVIKRLEERMVNGKLTAKEGSTSLLDTWIREGQGDYKDLLTFLSDMVLAGIDTVAYSLSFIMYHIAMNPVVGDKLYQELKGLGGGRGGAVTSEMVSSASYMKKCVKEALRLNPLAIGVGRVLTEDLVLSGYLVPEGTSIVTLNQVTSRLEKYVEQPDSFIPERFNGDGQFKRIHPFVTLPFSFGPRSCVGRRLAEQNMNIFLFRLFRNYRVEWIGPQPLDCVTSLINKPDAPLLFKFTPRSE